MNEQTNELSHSFSELRSESPGGLLGPTRSRVWSETREFASLVSFLATRLSPPPLRGAAPGHPHFPSPVLPFPHQRDLGCKRGFIFPSGSSEASSMSQLPLALPCRGGGMIGFPNSSPKSLVPSVLPWITAVKTALWRRQDRTEGSASASGQGADRRARSGCPGPLRSQFWGPHLGTLEPKAGLRQNFWVLKHVLHRGKCTGRDYLGSVTTKTAL